MKRVLSACALMSLLSACVPPPSRPVSLMTRLPPPYAEGEWALRRGRNTIEGRVAVRQPDGTVTTCADNAASLIPVTPSTRARMDALYGRDRNFALVGSEHPSRDPAMERLVRHEPCDEGGRFRFTRVADGDYFVVAGVPEPEPSSVKKEVSVRGGVTRRVLLTN